MNNPHVSCYATCQRESREDVSEKASACGMALGHLDNGDMAEAVAYNPIDKNPIELSHIYLIKCLNSSGILIGIYSGIK